MDAKPLQDGPRATASAMLLQGMGSVQDYELGRPPFAAGWPDAPRRPASGPVHGQCFRHRFPRHTAMKSAGSPLAMIDRTPYLDLDRLKFDFLLPASQLVRRDAA